MEDQSSSTPIQQFSRRAAASLLVGGGTASVAEVFKAQRASAALPPPVNRPELLPNTPGESTTIVDVARILSESQRREMDRQIKEVEKKSNVKIRVLAQTYPNSPGKAIQKYWNVDTCKAEGVSANDPTCKGDPNVLVYVHDTGGLGSANVNFSVGADVEAKKPKTFWRQVQNKFGNRFYIRDHGDAETVVDVVSALHDAFA